MESGTSTRPALPRIPALIAITAFLALALVGVPAQQAFADESPAPVREAPADDLPAMQEAPSPEAPVPDGLTASPSGTAPSPADPVLSQEVPDAAVATGTAAAASQEPDGTAASSTVQEPAAGEISADEGPGKDPAAAVPAAAAADADAGGESSALSAQATASAPSASYVAGATSMPLSSTSTWTLRNATLSVVSGDAVTVSGPTVTAVREGTARIAVLNLLGEQVGARDVKVYLLSGRCFVQSALDGGLYLDVSGASKKNGGNVIVWKRNGNRNQQFSFERQGDGSYIIRSSDSGRLVDVDGGSARDGANVLQWAANGGANQRWRITVDSANRLSFVSAKSGKLLDIAGASRNSGANVLQWADNGGLNQKWSLQAVSPKYTAGASSMPVGSTSEWTLDNCILRVVSGSSVAVSGSTVSARLAGASTVAVLNAVGVQVATRTVNAYDLDGYYYIRSAQSADMVLDISGASTADGGNMIIWKSNRQNNQKYSFARQPDGTFALVSAHSGKLVDVSGSSRANGGNVLQWAANGGANQRWRITVDSANRLTFVNKNSGKVLDIDGAKTVNGRNIIQWQLNGGLNQKWTLAAAPDPKSILSTAPAMAVAAARYSYSKPSYYGDGYTGTSLYQKVCAATMSKTTTKANVSWTVLSCDRGVSAAVKWSGTDVSFPSSADKMCQYLLGTGSAKWKNLGYWDGSESSLQPGDILVRQKGYTDNCSTNHICMYIGNDLAMQVYTTYIKGTDGDRGAPSSDAAWVSAHRSASNTSKAAPACIGNKSYASATTKQKMYVFRNIASDNSSKYANVA